MSHVCALCAGRNVDSVRMFLRHRATVDVVDKNGISLMHVAAMAGNPAQRPEAATPGPSHPARPGALPLPPRLTGPLVERNPAPSSRATICASVVLPRPGGPKNSV